MEEWGVQQRLATVAEGALEDGGGFPILGAAAGGYQARPRASPVPKEMGRWGSHHPLGPAGSRSANSTSSRGGRGACQQQTLRRVEPPPPSRAGLRLCEASMPAGDSRPHHVEAPNCRRETQAGPVSPQPKIDPLSAPYSSPHKSRIYGNRGSACFSARVRHPGSGAPSRAVGGLPALLPLRVSAGSWAPALLALPSLVTVGTGW